MGQQYSQPWGDPQLPSGDKIEWNYSRKIAKLWIATILTFCVIQLIYGMEDTHARMSERMAHS
jgi:hypothetical protein